MARAISAEPRVEVVEVCYQSDCFKVDVIHGSKRFLRAFDRWKKRLTAKFLMAALIKEATLTQPTMFLFRLKPCFQPFIAAHPFK